MALTRVMLLSLTHMGSLQFPIFVLANKKNKEKELLKIFTELKIFGLLKETKFTKLKSNLTSSISV